MRKHRNISICFLSIRLFTQEITYVNAKYDDFFFVLFSSFFLDRIKDWRFEYDLKIIQAISNVIWLWLEFKSLAIFSPSIFNFIHWKNGIERIRKEKNIVKCMFFYRPIHIFIWFTCIQLVTILRTTMVSMTKKKWVWDCVLS